MAKKKVYFYFYLYLLYFYLFMFIFCHKNRRLILNNPMSQQWFFLLAYCLIVSSFVFWWSRTKSSFSKVSIVLLLSRALFCILLVLSGLNKLSQKCTWKIVTELRSCTLSSTIDIFTKSRSLSLLPKAWIKWKKIVDVSLKASSSFLKALCLINF